MVAIDDFTKLDIRVVKVISSSRMEGSDKLLRLNVEIGVDDNHQAITRQIISGIGKSYEAESMVGQQLIAIVNLESRKMMGEESQGMILATGESIENITLIKPDKAVETGSTVR